MSKMTVTIQQIWRGQVIQNVLNFDVPDGTLSESQVADVIESKWIARVRLRQVNELSYQSIKVQKRVAGPPPPFIKQLNILGNEGAGTQLFTFTATVIQLFTATGGRRGRGRVYIAGHVNGAFVNHLIEVGQANFWNTVTLPALRASFLSGSNDSGITLGVMDKNDPSLFAGCTGMQVRSLVGMQRRRNLGIGI